MDFQVSALAYVISADGGSRGKEAAARNLEFPLVIKSYPLQSRDTRHCRSGCGREEHGMAERAMDEWRGREGRKRRREFRKTEGSGN